MIIELKDGTRLEIADGLEEDEILRLSSSTRTMLPTLDLRRRSLPATLDAMPFLPSRRPTKTLRLRLTKFARDTLTTYWARSLADLLTPG